MGQTAAETKREIEETRAQLTQTLAALETRAHAALDWRARVRRRPWLGVALAGTAAGVLVFAGLRLANSPWRRRPRRSLRRLLQGLKPPGLPARRARRVPAEAQAWLEAQRALMKTHPHPEPAARRILIRAAEAGASALTVGLVKILIARAQQPRAAGSSTGRSDPIV